MIAVLVSVSLSYLVFSQASYPSDVYLNVMISPRNVKLVVDQVETFSAAVIGGSEPYSYSWVCDEVVLSTSETCDYSFSVATEEPSLLMLTVVDSDGRRGYDSVIVYDPYDTPSNYVNIAYPYSYLIETDGSGWYRAVSNTGSILESSTNSTRVMENAVGNVTSGNVWLKEVAWNSSITVPENVMVIEQLDGVQKRFINVADSQGSPYTISTDETNYFAQDSALSYINSWTSTNMTEVWEDVRDNGLTSDRTWQETVYIKGNYSDIDNCINIPSQTKIVSDAIYTLSTTAKNSSIFYVEDAEYVDIIGGIFDGNSQISDSGTRATVSLIMLDTTSFSSVRNTYIKNTYNSAIYLNGTTYAIEISGNTINYTYNDGVNMQSSVYDVAITNNKFFYNGHVPVVLSSNHDVTVANNIMEYFGYRVIFDGIAVFENAYRNTIIGNIIRNGNSSSHGIYVNGYQNTISGNIINNIGSGGFGIYVYYGYDNIISNNVVSDCVSAGMKIGADSTSQRNQVLGNKVTSCQDGIQIGCGNNIISGNFINGNSRYGIWMLGATTNYNMIQNNRISENGNSGIRLEPADYTSISENTIIQNDAYGIILVASTSDYNRIFNNVLTDNVSGQIYNSGTSTTIKFNKGYVTENSISGANTTTTTAVINHGLASTATYVWCSFNNSAIESYTWTSSATQITVTATGTLPASWTVYAKVEYIP